MLISGECNSSPLFAFRGDFMINKLTGEPVSEEMQNVLKRLAVNEAVPESEIYALKEIKEANSCISSSKPTIELRNRTGIQLGVYNRLQNMGSAVTKSDGAVSFPARYAVKKTGYCYRSACVRQIIGACGAYFRTVRVKSYRQR